MDICLDVTGGKFNYRVGAIILHDDRLLLAKNSGDTFYYTIGGRVKFGEPAQEAALREALEETGLPLEIERLTCIHENFFAFQPENIPCHEICMFFVMKPDEKLTDMNLTFEESYGNVSMHWIPVDKLDEYEIYPKFISMLTGKNEDVQHIVTRDQS